MPEPYRIANLKVSVVREGTTQRGLDSVIDNPAMAAEIARQLIGHEDREHLIVLILNNRHKVIGSHTVGIGTLNSCQAHPRETFKAAILAGAAAIVIAHNHPSGDTTPSADDLALTARMGQAGELLGIPVLDHVIVGPEIRYCSLREQGLLS